LTDSNNEQPRVQYQAGIIRLDREGRWFHDNVEITHKRTIDLFNKSIKKDPAGGYMLHVGVEYCHIVVEDTAYFVKRVDYDGDRCVLWLSDGEVEDLNPATLRVGDENAMYCDVKGGEFPAKFTRPAYYQLTDNLEETDDGYGIRIGGKVWPIKS